MTTYYKAKVSDWYLQTQGFSNIIAIKADRYTSMAVHCSFISSDYEVSSVRWVPKSQIDYEEMSIEQVKQIKKEIRLANKIKKENLYKAELEKALEKPFGFITYYPDSEGKMITGFFFNATDDDREKQIERTQFVGRIHRHEKNISKFIVTKENYDIINSIGTYALYSEIEKLIK